MIYKLPALKYFSLINDSEIEFTLALTSQVPSGKPPRYLVDLSLCFVLMCFVYFIVFVKKGRQS